MSTGKTATIGLNLWEPEDDFVRVEFNADNAKIDEAIGALRAEAVKVEMGSYTGAGVYSEESPITLNFGFEPKFLYICKKEGANFNQRATSFFDWITLVNGTSLAAIQKATSNTTSVSLYVTWNGCVVSMYTSDSTSNLNVSGTEYCYIAIG